MTEHIKISRNGPENKAVADILKGSARLAGAWASLGATSLATSHFLDAARYPPAWVDTAPWALLAGGGLFITLRIAQGGRKSRRTTTATGLPGGRKRRNGIPVYANGNEEPVSFLRSARLHFGQQHPPPVASEFTWRVALSDREHTVTVTEERLLWFCENAWRRQESDATLQRRAPFSRQYFTHDRRMSKPEYAAAMHILVSCGVVVGRVQGGSGKLVVKPWRAVAAAKWWYA